MRDSKIFLIDLNHPLKHISNKSSPKAYDVSLGFCFFFSITPSVYLSHSSYQKSKSTIVMSFPSKRSAAPMLPSFTFQTEPIVLK